MTTQTVTLRLPESLYARLQQAARATRRSLDDVLLHAVQVGSPPRWDDAPAEFQADLAALDRLGDEALWRIARSRKTEADMERYQELLDKNANGILSADERDELARLRVESDRFMLCKAHAAALLRWRGYQVPPAEALRGAA
jgi:predicted transcriptional regulator